MTDVELIEALETALGGKPLDEVAPALVVAVARALVIDANGDMDRLNGLTLKFIHHLHLQIIDMLEPGDGVSLQLSPGSNSCPSKRRARCS